MDVVDVVLQLLLPHDRLAHHFSKRALLSLVHFEVVFVLRAVEARGSLLKWIEGLLVHEGKNVGWDAAGEHWHDFETLLEDQILDCVQIVQLEHVFVFF